MSFDLSWEATYSLSQGKHINKYPYGPLVTYFFRNLKRLPSPGNKRILELGCGVGNNMSLFLNEGFSAYGIDGSATAIKYAHAALNQFKQCHLSVMNMTELEFDNNFFDMIIDRQSIYANLFSDIEIIFSEVARVLMPGGIFISFLYNTKDYHYIKALDTKYAKKIEENTFENFVGGTFEGTGKAHFFTKEEIISLCKKNELTILGLSENSVNQIEPSYENRLSEFILVAQKYAEELI